MAIDLTYLLAPDALRADDALLQKVTKRIVDEKKARDGTGAVLPSRIERIPSRSTGSST